MKLRRLEIIGFKSFVDRTVLHLEDGISAILGPNGCGKSNVVDAIRWGMGEQNAKNLRGNKMEDIIFSGSGQRRAHGMAEVTMVFTGVGVAHGRLADILKNCTEIMVTRRLYRNGDSEYYINKVACRLKDITELFMDTGVGARAYSIIEQGKISTIVHAHPQQRRAIIEEVAGVTKYKVRRKNALSKIENARQNLVRLDDVIGEVERQLKVLRSQAGKARRFRELRSELKRLELGVYAERWLRLDAQLEDKRQQLKGCGEREEVLAAALAAITAQVEKQRICVAEQEEQVAQLEKSCYRLGSEIDNLGGQLQFISRETEAFTARRDEMNAELGQLQEHRRQGEHELEQMCAELQQWQLELDGQRQREQELCRQGAAADAEIGQCRAAVDAARNAVTACERHINQRENRLEQATQRLQFVEERSRNHNSELHDLDEQVQQARDEFKRCESVCAELEQQLNDAKSAAKELGRRLRQRQQQRDGCRQHCDGVQRQLDRCDSQLESLRELEKRSVSGDAAGPAGCGVVHSGILADRVRIPEYLEHAVAAAMGVGMKALLVDGGDAVGTLLGSTDNPVAAVQLPSAGEEPNVAVGQALAQLVDSDAEIAGHVQAAMRGMFYVESLTEVLPGAPTLPPGALLVDGDGRCLDWRGTVLLAETDASVRLLLENKRRIRCLEEERQALRQRLELAEGQMAAAHQALAQAQRDEQENRATCQQLQLQLQQQKNQQHAAAQELERLQQRRTRLKDEGSRQGEQRVELEELQRAIAVELEQLRQQREELQKELNLAEQRQRQQQQRRRKLHETLTAVKVECAAAQERCKSLQQQHQRLQETIDRQHEHAARVRERMEQLCQRQQEQLQQQEELQARIQALTARRNEQQQQLGARSEKLNTLRQQLHIDEEHLASRRAALARQREEKGQLQLDVHQLQLERDTLRRHVVENCNVDMAAACPAPVDDLVAAEKKIQRLRQRLETFGEVNLMAIDEYAAIEQRHEFLVSQRDDLLASIDDLHAAIARINRTTRQRFKVAFEQVNARFKEVFARLFVGGSAELELTDAADLLETGVEIVARPPGKKLQHIGLLSGGEKALTAVALVFAVFLIKPSPFCILDEVDAPLDDANIGRFNEMVREMSTASQFIIITHNVRTMQIADTLYGVTMQEPGVSSLVAVRMGDVLNDERLQAS